MDEATSDTSESSGLFMSHLHIVIPSAFFDMTATAAVLHLHQHCVAIHHSDRICFLSTYGHVCMNYIIMIFYSLSSSQSEEVRNLQLHGHARYERTGSSLVSFSPKTGRST